MFKKRAIVTSVIFQAKIGHPQADPLDYPSAPRYHQKPEKLKGCYLNVIRGMMIFHFFLPVNALQQEVMRKSLGEDLLIASNHCGQ